MAEYRNNKPIYFRSNGELVGVVVWEYDRDKQSRASVTPFIDDHQPYDL